jgi:hypothetical protein
VFELKYSAGLSSFSSLLIPAKEYMPEICGNKNFQKLCTVIW